MQKILHRGGLVVVEQFHQHVARAGNEAGDLEVDDGSLEDGQVGRAADVRSGGTRDDHRIKAGLVGANVAKVKFRVGRPGDVGALKSPLIAGRPAGRYNEIGG